MATKVLVIGLLVALIIAIIIYYKIKLPSFAIEIVKDRYERTSSAVKTVRAQKKKKESSGNTRGSGSSSKKSISATTDNQTLKSLIKDKLQKKVQKKTDDNTLQQLHINFPKDKPTFDSTILTKDPETTVTVSEERLYEKSQAIKNKLAEFNIDISIE